ncbi:MAG: hypothetical protein JJD98_15715 [Polaromonas sp.]|nr:hypothetical protein [Polaromonas sp.]
MIRIDALWLAVDPVDMRAGPERLLARVVQVFGAGCRVGVLGAGCAVLKPPCCIRCR